MEQKNEIEKKLREIALAPVKEEEFQDNPDLFFYKLCIKAYNLGVQMSADNAKIAVYPDTMEQWEIVPESITRKDLDNEESGCDEGFTLEIDKESILKLLIK